MSASLVKYPTSSAYDHVPSTLKALSAPPRQNPLLVQAAADHLEQLAQIATRLGDREMEELGRAFPEIPRNVIAGVSQRKKHGIESPRLPNIHGAEPRALLAPSKRAGRVHQQHKGSRSARVAQHAERQQQHKGSRSARMAHEMMPSVAYLEVAPPLEAGMYAPRPAQSAVVSQQQPPAPVLSGGGPSSIEFDEEEFYAELADQGLWESNPAILAPHQLLRLQPIPLLIQRREEALDGLRGLLHSLSRVRHSSHRLPPLVARAYHARLQHAIGWYRVTSCELVERIVHARRSNDAGEPSLRKTPSGELRQCYPPLMHNGLNILLSIGRGDLAFAPLPAAGDPLLLLWFSSQVGVWMAEDGVPPELLAPSNMHSILELARMQKAHEVLLTEAEIFGLPPYSEPPYEARDNELGVTFELLLYGVSGGFVLLSRQLRAAAILTQSEIRAARLMGKAVRGWIVRAQLRAHKAAIMLQAVYRRWKKVTRRRAEQARQRAAQGLPPVDENAPEASSSPRLSLGASVKGEGWSRASKILGRKYGGFGGGGTLNMLKDIVLSAKEKEKAHARHASTFGQAGSKGQGSTRHFTIAQSSSPEDDEDDERLAQAAARIQARIRGVRAQKTVLELAEAAEGMIDQLRNPRGTEAVASVLKAYRARNAFSMLLLKAFKQAQMAVIMTGSQESHVFKVAGCSEPMWRMSVETVRERCVQALLPAVAEHATKAKAHEEHISLTHQHEVITARLQYWAALKANALPPHLMSLTTFDESGAITQAKASLDALVAQRKLVLPKGITPPMHVRQLVGMVKALQDLQDAAGCEMRELEPLERQLRAYLAQMGVLDPASQEAPPPVNSNSGRAMLPTQSSQHRTEAIMAEHMPPAPLMTAKQAGGDSAEGLDLAAIQRAKRRSTMASTSSISISAGPSVEDLSAVAGGGAAATAAGKPATEGVPEGVALEERISAAELEMRQLLAVRELLVENRAIEAPPRYHGKVVREMETKREYIADGLRRLEELEAQYEHLSHFIAQVQGSIAFLESADAWDYRRQRMTLRGEFAQLGIETTSALRGETTMKKLRDRGVVIEAMQHYMEQELPALERAARERVEASATLHITIPTESFMDEALQLAFLDDLEDLIGQSSSGRASSSVGLPRFKVASVVCAPSPADSCLLTISVLEEHKGLMPVDDVLATLSAKVKSGSTLTKTLESTRKVLTTAPQHVAGRMGGMIPKIELLNVTTAPAHTIVHDSRTLADRRQEVEVTLSTARAELRPLQAKELIASAAQSQLWKLEGVDEVLAQCQNPRLLALKETERTHKPRLLQLARDSEAHISRYAEETQSVLKLEAKVEALSRLIACASVEVEKHGNGSGVDLQRELSLPGSSMASSLAKSGVAKKPQKDFREYSTNAFREVAQQILREKRLHDISSKSQLEAGELVSSKDANRRKYVCQGSLQLLKALHQEDKLASPSQPPPEPPPIGLIALSRFMGKSETLQREAIKLMAREAARIGASSLSKGEGKEAAQQQQQAHWAQMKAMIQMSSRRALVDQSILNERDVERAAKEMQISLLVPKMMGPSVDTAALHASVANGLAMLPFVVYFMRAPLPYPFVEVDEEAASDCGGTAALRARRYSTNPAAAPKAAPPALSLQASNQSINRSSAGGASATKPRAPPAAPSAPHFRNTISGEISHEHPLGHIYTRLARRAAKLAFKRKVPDRHAPEAWMEFVEPSGTPYYYCFLTQKREYEFPSLFPIGTVGIVVKNAEQRHAIRLRQRMLQQPKRRLSPGSLEAMRVNMEAEQRSKPRRAALLNKMPLPLSHIVITAQFLGIDTLTQTHLMWLASAALCDTLSYSLPVGWERRKTPEDTVNAVKAPLAHYYYNPSLRTAQWEHPSLTHWRSVLTELLSFERKHLSNDPSNTQHAGLGAQRRDDGTTKPGPKPMLWVGATELTPT